MFFFNRHLGVGIRPVPGVLVWSLRVLQVGDDAGVEVEVDDLQGREGRAVVTGVVNVGSLDLRTKKVGRVASITASLSHLDFHQVLSVRRERKA